MAEEREKQTWTEGDGKDRPSTKKHDTDENPLRAFLERMEESDRRIRRIAEKTPLFGRITTSIS